ncbi:MAG TPA: tRNA preQ1(34) S-adenosylmethionine ribosyltransferase-isomerase QueA [Bryobacteraceae bacterium]|nr:tRNA preQ1(34) S-adenosylmethionine ribosyltransferase-isomerase QueA [Bryobacteraceae bacterium]
MRVDEFDYSLPEELIAQEPLPDRDGARMLVVDRAKGTWEDRMFRDFPTYLHEDDCLVLNDSRVFPSRLYGRREHGTGRVEIFLTRQITVNTWEALVRPGKKMRSGERILISDDLSAEILGRGEFGERIVRLDPQGDLFEVLERVGHIPLPPYIRRPDSAEDRSRYQTVFAQQRGSVAAPTAGLHFTPEILARCPCEIARVTLHVGLGTFQPLHGDVVENITLHEESFVVPPAARQAIDRAKRVIAVGTTSVRAIESDWALPTTRLFLYPGAKFQRTGAMLTNFHLPKSSLLILICAFAGKDLALAAYRHAVEQAYRFFSYGDCMLIF